jgi:hypothetical protein
MIYRTSRILLEIVGVAVGGLLVIACIGAWRLSVAPIEARFIEPYLEQEIDKADLGFSVRVTDAKLTWHRLRPVLDLHFHGVSIQGQNGVSVGGVKDGVIGLSIPNLILGRPSLIEIDIDRPEITIVRDSLDRYSFRVIQAENRDKTDDANDKTGSDNNDLDFIARLRQLTEPGNDGNPLGRLQRVRIVDGRVIIEDRKLGIGWSAPDVDLDFVRKASGATAEIHVVVALPKHTAELKGQVRYVRVENKTYFSLDVGNFDVAAVAPLSAILSPLAALSTPVSGRVNAVIDGKGNVIGADASLRGDAGQIVLPSYYPQNLPFKSIGLDAKFTNAPRRVTLERLDIDLGDAKVAANGLANLDGQALSIDMRATLANIPLARSSAIWPQGVAVGGRDWVTTHITDGTIKSGSVHIVATGQQTDLTSLNPVVDGVFDYEGLEVHYFPALPPVRAIAGHGSFDATRMDLTVDNGVLGDNGALGDIAVTKGVIAITGFDQDDRAIDIGLTLDGPLKTALTVLDMKPLGYAHDLGISPDTVGGHLNVRTKFAFPLVSDLYFKQIALSAKGKLDGVAVPAAVGPRDVTAGVLAIALDKKGMTLNGSASLSGVPAALDWQESFQAANPIRTHIDFHSELDDAARVALAVVPPDIVALRGKIGVDGTVSIDRANNITLDVKADLANADLTADKFGLHKAAGQDGTADLSFLFTGDTLRRLSRIEIASKDLQVSGSIDFDPDGTLKHADFPRIADHRNNYALSLESNPGGDAYAISVKGAEFDAGPLLASSSSTQPPTHRPKIDMTLDIDHILTGVGGLDGVTGSASLSGSRLDAADVKAKAGGPVTFTYAPEGDGLALHFAAQDAGAALAGLSLTRGVRGGVLHLDGKTSLGDPRITTATLDMTDFRLVDAPIIARLVNAISLTGFIDLLSGQGLNFEHLNSQMDYTNGKITFRDGRTTGALGLSFEGDVDLDRDKIALKGTVVPANTLNSILAAIPVLGDVITGGSRGGLIGWTYTVSGTPNDPKVSVNPLSMFAPGFLRNLFFLGPSQAKPKAEDAPPVTP